MNQKTRWKYQKAICWKSFYQQKIRKKNFSFPKEHFLSYRYRFSKFGCFTFSIKVGRIFQKNSPTPFSYRNWMKIYRSVFYNGNFKWKHEKLLKVLSWIASSIINEILFLLKNFPDKWFSGIKNSVIFGYVLLLLKDSRGGEPFNFRCG